jgi:hypothetical protein
MLGEIVCLLADWHDLDGAQRLAPDVVIPYLDRHQMGGRPGERDSIACMRTPFP